MKKLIGVLCKYQSLLDTAKKYKVLTTNYLANGGDQMDFFKDCKLIYDTELLLRDVIINYIEETGKNNIKLNVQLDEEFKFSNRVLLKK